MTNKLVKLTKILFNTTVILTLLFFLICISNNKELIQKSFTIYCINFLLFFICISITTFIRLRRLSKSDSKARIIRFMKIFICSFLILNVLSIIFKSNSHYIFSNISTSLGTAFGVSFFDLLISKFN